MLKTWHLENFKSYRNPPIFKLGPINILSGANSSGKSSLIQSILLLKQTLQYGSSGRSLTLNGPLLRLGSFSDIRNFDSYNENIKIGMSFDFSKDYNLSNAERRNEFYHKHFRGRRNISDSGGDIQDLYLTLEYHQENNGGGFSAIPSSQSLNANLIRCSLSARLNMKDGEGRSVDIDLVLRDGVGVEYSDFGFEYEAKVDDRSRSEIFGDKPDPRIAGADIVHFLPSWIGFEYNETVYEAKRLSSQIFRNVEGLLGMRAPPEILPKRIVELINTWLIAHNAVAVLSTSGDATARDAQEALSGFTSLGGQRRLLIERPSSNPDPTLQGELNELRAKIELSLIDGEDLTVGLDFGFPRVADMSTDFLREFFKEGVRYLGPLRDSPRPVYQPEALESTTDVGYRGEHTAAVLDLNAANPVFFHAPPPNDELQIFEGNEFPSHESLHDAVVMWLSYLGVAHEVKTTDAGVYGNRLQVSTDGTSRLHDLTNVGVGVSQVLPIVVMALLAKPGSLLIFEQPELHLHPKVQARLADFFLALSADGKQILLETHSEYLIDRFRLRIALSNKSNFSQKVNIAFSYKENGETQLTDVVINEFGAIQNWPRDFFEQSQSDVAHLIKASSNKRKSKR